MMRHRRFVPVCVGLVSLGFALVFIDSAHAQISYTSLGGSYTQDFNSLPNTPTNTSLGTTASGAGWKDDTTTPASNQISIPGWYLYHGTDQSSAEGGVNGHQRMRIGAGTANTGGFWSYGAAADTDRALGELGSSTATPQNMALRLTNNTGSVLGQFTLSYTGEQWRDGGAATPNAQSITFGYAVTPNGSPPANIGALSVTAFSGLNFSSPTFTNTGSGVGLDGNNASNRTLISATVAGFVWNPGEDLWLRWNHPDAAGNDHGLAIDDLTFTANIPAEVHSAQTGLASVGTTWDDGQPAGAGKGYHVISGHTVTLDGAFAGSKLSVENGTVNINSGGSGQFFGAMTIEAGGNLTESVTGDVSIGSDSTSTLKLNRNLAFNLDGGSNFRLKAAVTNDTLNPLTTGNIDFNETSLGSGNDAQVYVDAASADTGTIRFNAGKQLNDTESAGLNTIEMNSAQPGGNILNYGPKLTTGITKLTFNQPGTFIHSTNNLAGTPGQRLQSATTFVVNAAVTVDLSQPLFIEERRFQVSNFQGNGNILVQGTTDDPTNPSVGGTSPNFTGITLNEFEVGAQGTDPSAGSFEPYSGTISTQDYINVEIRRNLPSAKFIVNDKGRLETGAQAIPLPNNAGTSLGEVRVNAGGVFEVGFEQANTNTVSGGGNNVVGHHVGHAILTTSGGRNGNLTLTGGANPSVLRMQINGTTQATQYDYINVNGNAALAGTLDVLINPVSCTGNDPCGASTNPTYSPNIGDTFDIINLTLGTVQGDYDGNGSVGNSDFALYRSTFGNTFTAGTGADGDRDGIVDAGDYAIWRKKFGASAPPLGTITGTFDSLNIVDPSNTLANSGYTLALVYSTPNKVQLQVVSASGSGSSLASASVPEPTAFALVSLGLSLLWLGGGNRRTH